MNPKLHRHLGGVIFLAVMFASLLVWNWSADHLPMWGAALVLVGILAGLWVVGRLLQRRREAWEAREAGTRSAE